MTGAATGSGSGRQYPPAATFPRVHTASDEISLRGMRFHARIGVLPHEADVPQPLEVDVTVFVTPEPGAAVVDYRALYAAAERVATAPFTAYIEDVAESIAAGALAVPRVERARVAVRKPHVALPGPLAHAEVVVWRSRSVAGEGDARG